MSELAGARAPAWTRPAAAISAGQLFSCLAVVGFANGTLPYIHGGVVDQGAVTAVLATFDISLIVWAAFWIGPALLLRARPDRPTRLDWAVAAGAFAVFALPLAPLSWVALTAVALYLLRDKLRHPRRVSWQPAHRGALVLLATCAAMFWGRVMLSLGNGPILGTDARMIGWVTGAARVGNTLRFVDGSGYVWIAPRCSSLSGVSLAILCWVLFMQVRGARWSVRSVLCCGLGCLAMVAINVARISAMVLDSADFDLIHGVVGATAASWLSILVLLAICSFGTRRARGFPA